MPVVDSESQLHSEQDPAQDTVQQKAPSGPVSIPMRVVKLDIMDDEPTDSQACTGPGQDCPCSQCVAPKTLLGRAACVMVGASTHTRERTRTNRFGAQALHWGVLFVGMLISLPFVMPTLSPSSQTWLGDNLLNSPGNWKILTLCALAGALFAYGFVYRLGTERVHDGCAMLRRLGPAAILGVAWSTIPSFAGVMLVLNMEPIRVALIGDGSSVAHMAMGMSIYLVGFVILAGFGCLPTVSQAILAGYAFGVPMGLTLALLGFGGASLVGYELVGRIAKSRVEQEIQRKPKALMLRDALVHASPRRALLLVTLLRASPSAPFALTNLLLVSLGVPRGVFFFGTLMGMFPRTLAAVLIGQQFTGWTGHIEKPKWMLVAGIVAAVLLLIVITRAAGTALKRVAEGTGSATPARAGL